jgi:hypothetical protein
MSTQVNFHLQLTDGRKQTIDMTPELEAKLRNALRRAVFDALDSEGLGGCSLTIRGPEVVSLF